jgi:dTDP-4-dehydrorhamnose reductase
MRVAVTGAGGRLGGALLRALGEAPFPGASGPIAWTRPDYDLDDPTAAGRLVARDRPEVVLHAAAWTDVDGCARDPDLAMRRNATAVDELAHACAECGADFVFVSTNEVFDGERTDGRGYAPGDPTAPLNPYGAAKLAGETAARAAYRAVGGLGADATDGPVAPRGDTTTLPGGRVDAPQLAIVRTSWLFGPGRADFPARMLDAADRARAEGRPLRIVADEIGSPTYAPDLADAIVELLGAGVFAGTHHIVGGGTVSRAGWASETLRLAGSDVAVEEIASSEWLRASRPPRWAVLAPTPLPGGEPLRDWRLGMADEMPTLLRTRAGARSRVQARAGAR